MTKRLACEVLRVNADMISKPTSLAPCTSMSRMQHRPEDATSCTALKVVPYMLLWTCACSRNLPSFIAASNASFVTKWYDSPSCKCEACLSHLHFLKTSFFLIHKVQLSKLKCTMSNTVYILVGRSWSLSCSLLFDDMYRQSLQTLLQITKCLSTACPWYNTPCKGTV